MSYFSSNNPIMLTLVYKLCLYFEHIGLLVLNQVFVFSQIEVL